MPTSRIRLFRLLTLFTAATLVAPPAHAAKKPSKKSPHAEIAAVARVETAPERVVHKNRREFLEFFITIQSFDRVPGDGDADETLAVKTTGRVHVVHDLSCGGAFVDLKQGDLIEIKGEYVHPPDGKDLIHFTHPADGSCGTAGGHPGGYLRKKS